MRSSLVLLAVLGLAACQPKVPDSGVGFGDYNAYVRNAAAAPAAPLDPMNVQAGAVAPASVPVLPPAPAPGSAFSPASAAAAIDRATGSVTTDPATSGAIIGQTAPAPAPMATTLAAAPMATETLDANGQRPRGNAPAGIKEEGGEMVHVAMSDEQDFNAVKARETIESDKERIARNKALYQIDQPTALPQRSGQAETSPAIQFALATSHPVGTPMYKRSGLQFRSPEAACQKYGSDLQAQEDFLASGGPERDRKGIDPDGDGYACNWNPAPFRAALQ